MDEANADAPKNITERPGDDAVLIARAVAPLNRDEPAFNTFVSNRFKSN